MSPLVMGILNVTPDSFAESIPLVVDAAVDVNAAVARALKAAADGAHIVDVGGESTRPGAGPVSEEIEQARVLPVIEELAKYKLNVSIDTRHSTTAAAAISAGASIVNDVSCGADPDMFALVAKYDVRYVLMHNRGSSADMYSQAVYRNIGADVAAELEDRVSKALAAGVRRGQIIVDPGIGFAKTPEQNWELLRTLDSLIALGLPVLLGVSRKRFLGELLAAEGSARDVEGRDVATAAFSMWAAQRGLWGVRVHDVRSTADVLAVAAAVEVECG
jgi:dihydropteroate synthase